MRSQTSTGDAGIRSFAKEENKGNHALKQMSRLHSDRQLRDEMDSRDLLYTFIVFASRAVWKLGASADISHLRDTRNEKGKSTLLRLFHFQVHSISKCIPRRRRGRLLEGWKENDRQKKKGSSTLPVVSRRSDVYYVHVDIPERRLFLLQ